MSRTWIVILVAVAALFIVSVVYASRIAAVGGALLLFFAIIYAFIRNRGGDRAEIARAEKGAHDLREELEEEDERRGT